MNIKTVVRAHLLLAVLSVQNTTDSFEMTKISIVKWNVTEQVDLALAVEVQMFVSNIVP